MGKEPVMEERERKRRPGTRRRGGMEEHGRRGYKGVLR